jgi:radical SAM superfamily enzyme YgiQ (UPF0313 family)
MYIASVLESKGYTVEIKELPSRIIVNYQKSVENLIKHLRKEDPELIGITCMAAQRDEACNIVKAIKSSGLSGKVVVGGVHASFMPEEVMGWGSDYAVLNEGEETLIELLEVIEGKKRREEVRGILYREKGKAQRTEKRNPVEDLDRLPLPAYHLIDKSRFTRRKSIIRGRWLRGAWIMTSRGCPSACTFCSSYRMFGKRVRYRSMDNIFEEIAFLVREFKIEGLVVTDDTFTVKKDRVFEFCRNIKREFPRLKWNCQARVNLFDEELAGILKKSNCIQVDFGVESGSQKVLNRLKKGINVEDTIRAFASCKKAGLRTLATIMVGNPDEQLQDLEKTRTLLKKIKPDLCAAYYTTPFPGTELYEEAERKNLIDGANRYWHQHTEPVPMSKVKTKILKNFISEFTRLNLARNYLSNIFFLLDMVRFSILNPGIFFRVAFNLISGHAEKALFLIANSVYFKRQN